MADVTEPGTPGRRHPRGNVVVALSALAFAVVINGMMPAPLDNQRLLRMSSDSSQLDEPEPSLTIRPRVAAGIGSTTSTSSPSTTTSLPPVAIGGTSTTIMAAAPEPIPPPPPETAEPAVPEGGEILVSRPIPEPIAAPTAAAIPSPWAGVSRRTGGGHVATEVGCAAGTSAGALDAFFRERIGPVVGHDYQHVYPLGGDRYLWIFQDSFIDYTGNATRLDQAHFNHNSAMLQDGACFTLYHSGDITAPKSFEPGTGEQRLGKWFWPMGGELSNGKLHVFWAEMRRDPYEPSPPNGLGWHPVGTWLATYDAKSLARLDFRVAPNSGVAPIYGYAVASDAEFTYMFGNTFEQNLQREGGYFNGPHSATQVWLARVPLGQFTAPIEYRSGDTWTTDAAAATPILQRHWAEFPMQPRYLAGQWVAATKINGYWGESLSIDVASDPWGPWTTVEDRGISPRGGDPLMNTYQAHLMPWTSGGSLVVSISQNARNMRRDAWPNPARYRLMFFSAAIVAPPPPADLVTTTTSFVVEESTTTTTISARDDTTTTTTLTTTVPTTIVPATTTSTSAPTSTTTIVSTTTTSTTTVPTTTPSTTTTTSSTTTTLAEATTTMPTSTSSP